MATKKKKHKGGGRWIQELSTDDSVEEQEGTFSGDNSAEEIAIELKRKAPDFQAAVGKITLYLNRAGKRLSESRRKELNRVKALLREMYDRKDRQKANKKKTKKKTKKKASTSRTRSSSIKTAANYMKWVDPKDPQKTEHLGDQYLELLLLDDNELKKMGNRRNINIKPKAMKEYKEWLLELFRQEVPYPDPHTQEEEKEDMEIIKKKMSERARSKRNIPVFEPGVGPILVPEGEPLFMTFASDVEALQFLSDLTKEKIIVAKGKVAKGRTCPECKKGVGPNGYCLTCKDQTMENIMKKKKEASENLIFASNDEAIQYLADLTGKNIQVAE